MSPAKLEHNAHQKAAEVINAEIEGAATALRAAVYWANTTKISPTKAPPHQLI